jgi:hypothetical protein
MAEKLAEASSQPLRWFEVACFVALIGALTFTLP